MLKTFLLVGAAGAAVAGLAPALAQDAQAPQKAERVHTRAEVQTRVAQHFARLDTNRDGFVVREEAKAAGQALRQRAAERRGDRADRRFDRMDSNDDGSISRAEFDSAHAQRLARRGEAGERRMHRAGRRMIRGHLGGRMFAMADTNKDQRVSLAEAQAAALAHFDRVDANRDGRITREERRQTRRHMSNERRPG